jgi:LmbE family N-acetylglucosaminyl deacetylase/ActR/RegA family two-component response regulator
MNGGSATTPGRILVVDDDLDSAQYLVHVLRNRGGFQVSHTQDPATALARAAAEDLDLVVTDVRMPGMSGIELLEALRKHAPDLPVAVVTAYPSLDNAVRALRGRADEFLEKPVRPDTLVAMASALVAKGRATRLAQRRSVLAIGAHPDDVEIGAGGTLLAHRERGDTVSVLTLSQGPRGGRQAAGSRQAASVLGVSLYLEDMRDTQISEGDPTIAAISRVVEEVHPVIVYTHSMHDRHQDHRNTYLAAMVAARGAGGVYCFQSPSATVDFRPTRFISVDDQLECKLAAIGAFSQGDIRAELEPDLIQATARYWSRFTACRYAEAFEVIHEATEVESTPAGGTAAAAAGFTGEPAAMAGAGAGGGAGSHARR